MLLRFFSFVLIFALSDAVAFEQSRQITISSDLRVQQISEDVWLHISFQEYKGVRFPANGIFITTNEGIVIVDTPWGDAATTALLHWLHKEFSKPITGVFASHFHADSLSGLQYINNKRIPVYVSPKTLSFVAEEKRSLLTVIPELANIGNEVTLKDVKVFYPGGAHSRDNIIVYYPKDKVLFGSCAVRSPDFRGRGNVKDADETTWPDSIDKVLTQYPDVKIVVPGHGKPGDSNLLNYTIALF